MKIKRKLRELFPFLLWVGLILFFIKSLAAKIIDYDLWWHLASGREMVEKGVFLKKDIFSYTMAGTEWINFEWLSQVIVYVVVKYLGLNGIFYGKVFMGMIVVWFLIRCLKTNGAYGPWFWLALFVGFVVVRPRLHEKMELATLLMLPLFVLILSSSRNQPPHTFRRIPWILFGLMVLWCNLHGGFLYGFGVVVLFAVGARFSGESKEYIAMTDHASVLMIVAVLINPYGPRLFLVFVEHLFQFSQSAAMIEEWFPPGVRDLPLFWVLFLSAGSLLVLGLLSRRPEAKFWGPAVLLFAVWGGLSYRNAAISCFVLLPFAIDAFSKWELFHPIRSNKYALKIGWALCLAVLLAQSKVIAKPLASEPVQWSRFPVAACRFIQDQNIRGKMFNAYEYGGYIGWVLGPDRKVMMDGRYLFQPILIEHTRLHQRLYYYPQSKEWSEYLSNLGVNYAVTTYGEFNIPSGSETGGFSFSPLNAMFPRSKWALVFWDDSALLFLKRIPAFEEVIKKFEYRSLWPYNLEQMSYFLRIGNLSKEQVRRDLALHRDRVGFSVVGSEIEKRIADQ